MSKSLSSIRHSKREIAEPLNVVQKTKAKKQHKGAIDGGYPNIITSYSGHVAVAIWHR